MKTLSQQTGTSVLGFGETEEHPVVLAHLGGAWRIGVQTDHAGTTSSPCLSQFAQPHVRVGLLRRRGPGPAPGGIACVRDRLPEAVRNGVGDSLERRPRCRGGARIRNRPQLVVSLAHEGVVDRARLVEAMAGETVRCLAELRARGDRA
jgi:hypothetical protein